MHHHLETDLSWEASERSSPIYKHIYEKRYKEKFSLLSFMIVFVQTLENINIVKEYCVGLLYKCFFFGFPTTKPECINSDNVTNEGCG